MNTQKTSNCTCQSEALRLHGMAALCPQCAAEWDAWLMADTRALNVITDEEVLNHAAA